MTKPLIPALSRLWISIKGRAHESVHAAADTLEEQIKINASITDHSLEQLKELDHPYSIRHGGGLHDPDFQVHKQTGTLLGAVGQVTTELPDGSLRIKVGVDASKAPHATAVIYGTARMVARDFVGGSYRQIREKIRGIIQTTLVKK